MCVCDYLLRLAPLVRTPSALHCVYLDWVGGPSGENPSKTHAAAKRAWLDIARFCGASALLFASKYHTQPLRCFTNVELRQKGTKAEQRQQREQHRIEAILGEQRQQRDEHRIEAMLSRVALLSRRALRVPAARALSDKVVAMRLDHGAGGLTLDEADTGAAPLPLFRRWFDAAVAHPEIAEANAVTLATVDAETLQPSCRVVLLKGYDDAGFTWFTNYTSRKASELETGKAALTFWWPALERSVRVEGDVVRVAADETAAYFTSRPRASQIGAWVSRQSSSVTVEALVAREKALDARFGDDVPVPDFWGAERRPLISVQRRAPRHRRNTPIRPQAVTGSRPGALSSGRAAPRASTTASSSRAGATARGRASGWRRDGAGPAAI